MPVDVPKTDARDAFNFHDVLKIMAEEIEVDLDTITD